MIIESLSPINAGLNNYTDPEFKNNTNIGKVCNGSVLKKIDDLLNKNTNHITNNPNCWGTAMFVLGIIPTCRYVDYIEYGELVNQAALINLGDEIPNNAVLNIWNNSNAAGKANHNHVALLIDREKYLFFEKTGSGNDDNFQYSDLQKIITDAKSKSIYNDIILADDFNQLPNGKYATWLDFSNVPKQPGSKFEEDLNTLVNQGSFFHQENLDDIIRTYKKEIPEILNSRDLSLSINFFNYLKNVDSSIDNYPAYLISIPKDLRKIKIRDYKEKLSLQNVLIQNKDFVFGQIEKFKRIIEPPNEAISINGKVDSDHLLVAEMGQLEILPWV
jgi:hypothetical protein